MRRLLYLAALSMVIGLVFAPVALAQSRGPSEETQALCGSFATQFDAQQYYNFNATPHEREILDPNGDGIVCSKGDVFSPNLGQYAVENDALPGQPTAGETMPDEATTGETRAGEPTTGETATGESMTEETRTGEIMAGKQVLPATGGLTVLLPAAGVLLVTGLIGMRLVRRS